MLCRYEILENIASRAIMFASEKNSRPVCLGLKSNLHVNSLIACVQIILVRTPFVNERNEIKK
jgi:hypothetical protein